MMLPPGATEEDVARLTALYGLDRTIPEQFLSGSAGLSGATSAPPSTSASRSWARCGTPSGDARAVALALLIAVLLGGAAGPDRDPPARHRTEAVLDVAGGAVLSVPDFLWGLILVLGLGVLLPVFPITGRIDPALESEFWTDFYLFESLLRLRLDLLGDVLSHTSFRPWRWHCPSRPSSPRSSSRVSRRRCTSTT
jgi:peptide/nickel transport system permease protein